MWRRISAPWRIRTDFTVSLPLQPRSQGGPGAQLCGEKQAVVAGNRPHRQRPPPGEGGGASVVLQQAAEGETGQNQPQPQLLSGQNGLKLHHADE